MEIVDLVNRVVNKRYEPSVPTNEILKFIRKKAEDVISEEELTRFESMQNTSSVSGTRDEEVARYVLGFKNISSEAYMRVSSQILRSLLEEIES